MSHEDSMYKLTLLIEQSVLRKTDCSGKKQDLSRTYLACHELESEVTIIVYITE